MDTAKVVTNSLEEAWASESTEVLVPMLQSGINRLGFSLFAYYLVKSPKKLESRSYNPVFVSNYPLDWIEYYMRQKYYLTDPVMVDACSRRLPVRWGPGGEYRALSDEQQRIMDEAREFGICRGLTIAMHGPGDELGVFTVASDTTARVVDKAIHENGHALHLIGAYAHTIIVERIVQRHRPTAIDLAPRALNLTLREKEVLYWTAQGKSSWEISKIINRSNATVNYHIQHAVRKLDACNKCHAAVKAAIFNLIDP